MKGLFKTVKTQLGWKKNGPPQKLIIEGKSITAPKKIADEQINYFLNKIEKVIKKYPQNYRGPPENFLKNAIGEWGVKANER